MKSLLSWRNLVFLLGLAPPVAATAGEEPPQPPVPNQVEPASPAVQPMRLEEPMPIGMRKEGMKKGDVMRAAKQKHKYMKEMMQQEKAAAERGDR
jgi:hypothetical protein